MKNFVLLLADISAKVVPCYKGNFKRSRTSPFLLSTGSSSSQCLLYRDLEQQLGLPVQPQQTREDFLEDYHGLDEFKEKVSIVWLTDWGDVLRGGIVRGEGLWQKERLCIGKGIVFVRNRRNALIL